MDPPPPHRLDIEPGQRLEVVLGVEDVAGHVDLPIRRLVRDLHGVVHRRAGLVVEDACTGDRELVEEVGIDVPRVVGLDERDGGFVDAGPVDEDLLHPLTAAVAHDDVGGERAFR